MISELELLAIFERILEARGRFESDEVRAAAILASLFLGKLVRYDSIVESILVLKRKGFLRGDLEQLVLTPEGRAMLRALGDKRIGISRLQSLRKLAEPLYTASSTLAFVRTFGPRVTEIVKAQRSKLSAVPGSIVLCAMLVRFEGLDCLHLSSFELPNGQSKEEANLWVGARRAQARLSRQLKATVHMTVDVDKLLVVAPEPVASVEFEGHVLRCKATERLGTDKYGPYIVESAQNFFADRLVSEGYSPVGSVRRVFVRYAGRKGASDTTLPAIRLSYQLLGYPYLLVWMEEFTKPWTRALDLIAGAKTREEMEARLAGQLFRTLPYERPASLLGISPERDLSREVVPGTSLTFVDYWCDLGYELEERLQPLLLMQTKTGKYSYPAETILVRAQHPELPSTREPIVLTPEERSRGLAELAALVFPEKTIVWQSLRVVLESAAPSLDNIPNPWRPRAALINPPLLCFANSQYSSDPLDVFTKGPEAGSKKVLIHDIYRPAQANAGDCAKAVEILCRHYGSRGFGEARVASDLQNIGYNVSASTAELGAIVRRTVKPRGTDAVGISILEEGDEAYYAFKRFYPEHSGAPLQAIQLETVPTILAGNRAVLDQLALNLYLKRLGPKESAWTLLSPAGGSEKTSFVAIAFSRGLEPRRAGKGVAVLHDAIGRGLNWNAIVTPGERTITEAWFNTVLEQIQPLLEGEPSDRLVLYRTGHLYPGEVDAITRSLGARLRLRKVSIDFVSVLNEHRRFFMSADGVVRNPPPGTAIFWSDNEVLLCESGFAERGIWKGTVVPVGLKRVLGESSVDQIAAEYHDLTHLSWSAPSTTWKHPLVMKIAERLAEASREGVPAGAIRFLPL